MKSNRVNLKHSIPEFNNLLKRFSKGEEVSHILIYKGEDGKAKTTFKSDDFSELEFMINTIIKAVEFVFMGKKTISDGLGILKFQLAEYEKVLEFYANERRYLWHYIDAPYGTASMNLPSPIANDKGKMARDTIVKYKKE